MLTAPSLLSNCNQIFVGPDKLGIVLQNGRFARLLVSGWHTALNPYDEQLVAHFPIESRFIKFTSNASSKNDCTVTVTLDIQYRFDPYQAARKYQMEMINIVLSQHTEFELHKIVTHAARYSLQNEVNLYDSEELHRASTRAKIEQSIRQHLYRSLTPLGIFTDNADSISIETITSQTYLDYATTIESHQNICLN